jgi:hypothetical protein
LHPERIVGKPSLIDKVRFARIRPESGSVGLVRVLGGGGDDLGEVALIDGICRLYSKKLEVIDRKSMWTFGAVFETKTPTASLSGSDEDGSLRTNPTGPKNIALTVTFPAA